MIISWNMIKEMKKVSNNILQKYSLKERKMKV